MNRGMIVNDEHFAYLRLQKGRLEPLSNDRKRWQVAYEHDLASSYEEMRPYLPARCWGFLDIGSGLGGIDVLLSRHYGGTPFVNMLDGEDDPPEMRLHRETFCSRRVAKDFLRVNGVRLDRIRYFSPDTPPGELRAPYDLVLSLGSWCFHYEPAVYLDAITRPGGLDQGAVLIVDLRRDKPEWAAQLSRAGFRGKAIIRDAPKYQRLVMERAWTPSA